ncbi:MAG: cysteine hydrolase family protein [Candidatus Bipolaricaulia bacterium]
MTKANGKKLLIVVDMQNDFMDPEGALYCGDHAREIIPQVQRLVEQHLDRGDPVVFTQDTHEEGDWEFEIWGRHCVAGEWGHRFIPELEKFSDRPGVHVVQKSRYSAFYDTNLDEFLKELDPESVTVTGVCTSICVMDTIGGLRNRGYPVTVHQNCVADFDPEMHTFSLKRMENIYTAEVL